MTAGSALSRRLARQVRPYWPHIAGIFLPEVFKWFPFSAASAVIVDTGNGGGGGGGGGGPTVALGPDLAVVVVAIWLIGALVLAALWTERAEIAG